MTHAQAVRSMELFAKDVMPRVRQGLNQTARAV
jgi:hypothetical protein